jgi:NAD(P)-dependent dehydrogenase (short-subunit alcohol dehydrogenase family)
MQSLAGQRVIVTGGSRGLGLGIVEALVARDAKLTVIARTAGPLADVQQRLGVAIITGDVTEPGLADRVLVEVRPDILVLNAGLVPPVAPLHEHTWQTFSAAWEHDVKAGFLWLQAALRHLSRGRVLVMSSGAAVAGSPLSGGYAGAKRMLWMMADYANACAVESDRDLRFQTIVPLQIIGDTGVGEAAASAYARRKGITPEAFLAGFGAPLTPRQFGEHVATVLADPCHRTARAFTIKGDTGLLTVT